MGNLIKTTPDERDVPPAPADWIRQAIEANSHLVQWPLAADLAEKSYRPGMSKAEFLRLAKDACKREFEQRPTDRIAADTRASAGRIISMEDLAPADRDHQRRFNDDDDLPPAA